jgi:hypothetical protein
LSVAGGVPFEVCHIERSRDAHCDVFELGVLALEDVFSTTLELTGETLELTVGTFELTGGTLELTGGTLELTRIACHFEHNEIQMII